MCAASRSPNLILPGTMEKGIQFHNPRNQISLGIGRERLAAINSVVQNHPLLIVPVKGTSKFPFSKNLNSHLELIMKVPPPCATSFMTTPSSPSLTVTLAHTDRLLSSVCKEY